MTKPAWPKFSYTSAPYVAEYYLCEPCDLPYCRQAPADLPDDLTICRYPCCETCRRPNTKVTKEVFYASMARNPDRYVDDRSVEDCRQRFDNPFLFKGP